MVKHMWPFLWSILKLTIKLKTFGEGLNIEKYNQIFKCVAKHYSTSGFYM
jgi:hypothetical protein